eukprot:TRINITY_DN5169_c0_g1_i1.p1 TRINITY_DN5169_c0_g1~~TRINITY_DN5169_c0_g1_i1.p1  ORF type:complete len:1337 (+),score=386.99 TRINITY_DN5169_c0_g1_i1:91-4101(+)
MKWQLSDAERARMRACLSAIEYPQTGDGAGGESSAGRRQEALLQLKLFIEGDRLLVQGVAKAFYATLFPLLYSVLHDAGSAADSPDAPQGPGHLALSVLGEVLGACSRKQAAFLLVSERFKALVGRVDSSDRLMAVLSCRVVVTLLKIEDSVKEQFWELNLHQVVRRAVTRVLSDVRTAARQGATELREVHELQDALLDVLLHSAGTSRHRQELYGSGYGLCTALLQCAVDLVKQEGSDEGLSPERAHSVERLVLACAHLVRENKLNQDSFRQQPNLGLLGGTLRDLYGTLSAAGQGPQGEAPAAGVRLALEVFSLCLQYGNDGVRRIILQEAPAAQVGQELHGFQSVLLEGLENLRRHHYDVDVVVRSLASIEQHLTQTEAARVQKSYVFRNTFGAWSLLCLCLNNIDERIMFQACCLTCTLVRGDLDNQCALINLDGIETLSEILGDYNLDIQLVGMRILDALKDSGSERMKREVGDPCIVEHLLRVVKEFPAVFTQIVNSQPHWGANQNQDSQTPSVTTPLNPNPYDLSKLPNLEKQVTIVEYAISLLGDIVVHCPNIRHTVLELNGEQHLLQLLSYSYSYCHAFYASIREQAGGRRGSAGTAAALLRLPRAQTAPGPRRTDGSDADGGCRGRDGDDGGAAASPIKKLSSLYIKILLGIVEVTCRALSNVVRQLPQAQWSFHKHGGTESVLQYLNCLLTFSEDPRSKQEHEAWGGSPVSAPAGDGAGEPAAPVLRLRLTDATVSQLEWDDSGDERNAGERDTPSPATVGGGREAACSNGTSKRTASARRRRSFVCQNGWLVGPELLASLLLLAVNAIEANKDLQAALREGRVRLLIHYLLSHPSSVVVNASLLLVSHLCFDNPENQRFFASPCTVERICSLAATSYSALVGSIAPPPPGMQLQWQSHHLHLLTPPREADPSSFYAFQGLAYSMHCFATLLQHNQAARVAAFEAELQTPQGDVSPWLQLLAYCVLTPSYPVQDAALLLLKNLLHGGQCQVEWRHRLVNLKVVDCLVRLICMDRANDEAGAASPPGSAQPIEAASPGPGRIAELKWLSNKAFQLLTSLGETATQVVMAHILALLECMAPYQGTEGATGEIALPFVVPVHMYRDYDDVDCYNALTEYIPILNGLVYSSEEARRSCVANGGAQLVAALCCRRGLDLDLKLCAVYALANMTVAGGGTSPATFHSVLRLSALDAVSRVALTLHSSPGPDEDAAQHAAHLEELRVSVLQVASALVLAAGSPPDLEPGRTLVARERRDLVALAAAAGVSDSERQRREALTLILTLCEDDAAAVELLRSSGIREVLERARRDAAQLPRSTVLQVSKHLAAAA